MINYFQWYIYTHLYLHWRSMSPERLQYYLFYPYQNIARIDQRSLSSRIWSIFVCIHASLRHMPMEVGQTFDSISSILLLSQYTKNYLNPTKEGFYTQYVEWINRELYLILPFWLVVTAKGLSSSRGSICIGSQSPARYSVSNTSEWLCHPSAQALLP